MTKKREQKGIDLVLNGHIKPLDSSNFKVDSESEPDLAYTVSWKKKRWECNCKDFVLSNKKCKHVYGVCTFLSVRDTQIGLRQDPLICPKCGKNDCIGKDGFSESRSSGLTQRFVCTRCNEGFSPKMGFEGMRGQRMVIILSLDLYFRGLSLRQISGHFQSVYKVIVSHTAIYYWIKRYVELVSRYLEKKKILTSQRWQADETVVHVQGKFMRLWSILDSESKDLIAQHVSLSRDTDEATKLIEKALAKSENLPDEIITDGLPSYSSTIDQKFETELKHPILHIQASINSGITNNRMERMQKTIKSRYKTISGFGSQKTAQSFSNGFAIHYNNIKKHDALGGKTPNEMVAKENNENNWADLIRNAKKSSQQLENL